MNERERAFLALRRVERQASRIDFAVEANEGDSDRGFLLTVVRGAVRWRPRLDFAIEKLSGRNIESIDPDVATLLRVALYQLLEMDAPSYAVVNEHVTIAANRFPRAKGFVNAVLRKATRVPADALVPDDDDARSRSFTRASLRRRFPIRAGDPPRRRVFFRAAAGGGAGAIPRRTRS